MKKGMTILYLDDTVVVELDLVPLQHRSTVDEYRPLPFRGHEEVPSVPKADRGLLPGHFDGGTFQAQVHVDCVVARTTTNSDLTTTLNEDTKLSIRT